MLRVVNLPPPLDQLAAGPIFVVGVARSGTTWIYDILTEHPQAYGVLESMLFSPGLGLRPLFSEDHWRSGRPPWGLRRIMTREQLIADVRELTARWLGRGLMPEHRFFVEKTPAHTRQIQLIAEVFPEARFVHVLRDGRDVAVSVRAARGSWGSRAAWKPGRTHFQSARWWRQHVEAARRAGAALGADRFLEVRYEDVKARPHESYRRLYAFCGMPYDDDLLERVFEATDFDRNFEGGESSFRRAGRVGDWRTSFGLRAAASFAAGSGRALLDAGYEQSRWWWLRPR
ncbi:MAG: hypothetical protein QOD53_1095 [Thermoleophilaceae bacterium]|jgi:hypothetical protein|nr:hypothetical protein [Thermoleophilaceae bacterium]